MQPPKDFPMSEPLAKTFAPACDLSGYGIALEPLGIAHAAALAAAAADGALWNLHFTSVPEPEAVTTYIESALAQNDRSAFAVRELASDSIVGSTSFHDILPKVKRLDIGYTWYAKSSQRTSINTACKYVLLSHAFDTLQCHTVGWRTDQVNFVSQRAIERLGAKKDGVIRGQALRRDGSIRDTVMYSMTKSEWDLSLRAHLLALLARSC
jgi:N-acetyltransferase